MTRGGSRLGAHRRWWWAGLLAAGLVATAWVVRSPLAGQEPGHGSARPTAADIARCIRDPGCHATFVAAHRGEGWGGVANSREAVRKAVEGGVPVVEIDLRGSRDGGLFVMHDGKLEDSTDLRGRFEAASSEEIARARLRNGEPLPHFEDVYAITRGRSVLSVDFKVPAEVLERMADWIHANGSFDDLIFFANTGEEIAAAARAKKRYPEMLVMVRLLDTRVTVESTRAAFGGRLPEILHTERVGADEVARLHAQDVKVYMNALPVEHEIQPFKYFALRALLGTGVDFVLTGEPAAMMRRVGGGPIAR